MNSLETTQLYIDTFNKTKIINKSIEENIIVSVSFVNGPSVQINGNSQDEFLIEFLDSGKLVHSSKINCNMWTRAFKSYFIDWQIKITNLSNNELIYDQKINFQGKKVYISFDSSSIGDTLAWIPYVEEFRKKWNCNVVVSTFHNDLFKEQYSNVEFVTPGVVVRNLYAMYKIGWYYDGQNYKESSNPRDFKKYPLQQTICDILGLEYVEIKPKLKQKNIKKIKKVGIGIHSTAQSKYWNNNGGWQKVVDYLKGLGYEVMIYSKENDGYMGNFHPKEVDKFKGGTLQDVIDDLSNCELFIGLGSGLSWLAWACGLPVVLISGFSKPYSETVTDTYRVFNENVCNGCFNTHKLDAGDWNWCPLHKGTERQFECTKQITAQMVIDKINEALKSISI